MGVPPLENQQIAGLVMWIPGSIAYVAAALWLLAGRLRPPAVVAAARPAPAGTAA